MRGFKALNKDLTNRYGYKYLVNKNYKLNGDLKWQQNGFHFCIRPEDTLRYVDSWSDNFVVTEIEANGELELYEDDYYGYYDMYVSSEMKILRVLSREELFEMVFNSNNVDRVKRLASSIVLTQDEIDLIKDVYPLAISTIEYYQTKEMILKLKNRS